jgi:hypothetical protein
MPNFAYDDVADDVASGLPDTVITEETCRKGYVGNSTGARS